MDINGNVFLTIDRHPHQDNESTVIGAISFSKRNNGVLASGTPVLSVISRTPRKEMDTLSGISDNLIHSLAITNFRVNIRCPWRVVSIR